MKAINIYTYSRIQEDMATEYENILSQRSKKLNVKVQEFVAIKTLVDLLLDIDIETKHFENFFASFTIEQIGKEFDLIKLDKGKLVLNIELKRVSFLPTRNTCRYYSWYYICIFVRAEWNNDYQYHSHKYFRNNIGNYRRTNFRL